MGNISTNGTISATNLFANGNQVLHTGNWSNYCASASHNHTSLTGITSLRFDANSSDVASITTTIDGNTTYFDFYLADDGSQDMFRWRFNRWDNATSSAIDTALMTLTTVSSASSSANLVVNGNITASNFYGVATYAKYLSQQNMSNTDLNNITTSGYYYGYTGMTNAPVSSGISVLEVIAYSKDWIIQRFTQVDGARACCIWTRRKYSGTTWSDWMRFEPSRYGTTLPTSGLYTGMTYFKYV